MIINEASYKTFSYTGVNGRELELELELPPMKEEKSFPFRGEFYGVSRELTNLAKGGLNIEMPERDNYMKLPKDFIGTVDIITKEGEEKKVLMDIEEGDSNIFYRVLAKEGSKISLTIVQRGGDTERIFKSIAIEAMEEAEVNVLIFELGGKSQNTSLKCDLLGRGSKANIKGIYFGYGDSHLDYSYHVRHFGEESISDITLDGALRDRAKKLVKSNLDFMQGSKKGRGKETESTILLSDDVVNKSVPILLSNEDDVEGAHAASSGKIDESVRFYIMSRGFSKKEAESLILMAKFEDTISLLDNEALRDEIRSRINEIVRL